eukprot:11225828-Alexandrium_andersonii.AAC.1
MLLRSGHCWQRSSEDLAGRGLRASGTDRDARRRPPTEPGEPQRPSSRKRQMGSGANGQT